MKKILKNKRGFALGSAVAFMVITFTLCFLLTSLTLIGHYQVKIDNMMLLDDVEIDQIGEDYLASLGAGEPFEKTYENYVYEVNVTENTLTVWHKDNLKTAVLYVEAEIADDGTVRVIAWRSNLSVEMETEAPTEVPTEEPTETPTE